MATTVTQTNYWVLTLSSNTSPAFNFKFVVDVFIDGIKRVRIKQPKNPSAKAHISFEKIIKDYIETTNVDQFSRDVHRTPQNTAHAPISHNDGSLKEVTFKFYEEYSTTATGTVSITSSTTAADLTLYKINYANEWEELMDFDSEYFCMNDSRHNENKFLTILPTTTSLNNSTNGLLPLLTSFNDYKTLSFLNLNDATQGYDGEVGSIIYRFYEEPPKLFTIPADDVQVTNNYVGQIVVDNNSTNGGEEVTDANITVDEELLFVPAGAGNVQYIQDSSVGGYQLQSGQGIKYFTVNFSTTDTVIEAYSGSSPSRIAVGDRVRIMAAGSIDFTDIGAPNNNANTYFYADATTDNGTGNYQIIHKIPASKYYVYEITECQQHDEYTLAWKNKFGTWDYYYFNGKSEEAVSYDRKADYERLAGNWGGGTFTLNTFERGKIEKVEGKKTITVSTQFITEEYNDYFNGLLMSNDVMLITSSNTVPVNIKDKNFAYKKLDNNQLVQYSFTFEFAHDLKRII